MLSKLTELTPPLCPSSVCTNALHAAFAAADIHHTMTTAQRSNALVFKHPNTLPVEHRDEMMSKLSSKHIDLEENKARLLASEVSAERTQHKLKGPRIKRAMRGGEQELLKTEHF